MTSYPKPISWSIFVDPRRSLKQKLKGVSADSTVGHLETSISKVLSEEGINWKAVE